jgi:hypothetical protein
MTIEEWREHDKRWRASGKRQIEYCRVAGISWHVFRLNGTKSRKLESETGFTKIEVPTQIINKKFLEVGISSNGKLYVNFNLEIVL